VVVVVVVVGAGTRRARGAAGPRGGGGGGGAAASGTGTGAERRGLRGGAAWLGLACEVGRAITLETREWSGVGCACRPCPECCLPLCFVA
jgi:hypothetical protein